MKNMVSFMKIKFKTVSITYYLKIIVCCGVDVLFIKNAEKVVGQDWTFATQCIYFNLDMIKNGK